MKIIGDGTSVLVRSPAKLNLSLAILGRRDDGFHEIETVMVKISMYDTLRCTSRSDEQIVLSVRKRERSDTSSIPEDSRNLVVRAAETLRHRAGIRFGADLLLEKSIPAEAGLAGGSGNAAAALAGLNALWKTGLEDRELVTLASALGSDIPFFLSSGAAAFALGRGEIIDEIELLGPLYFVIVKPPFGLSTAEVYRAFARHGLDRRKETAPLLTALATGDPARISRGLFNDLEAPAESIAADLPAIRNRLMDECRYGAMMTGSGSACFGVCSSAREASRVASRLRALNIGRVFAATTV